MHLNDSSSIALHLKTYSIPKSKFWKILVENNTIIAHEINKIRLQSPTYEKKKIELIELTLKIVTMFWNTISPIFNILFFLIIFYFR